MKRTFVDMDVHGSRWLQTLTPLTSGEFNQRLRRVVTDIERFADETIQLAQEWQAAKENHNA